MFEVELSSKFEETNHLKHLYKMKSLDRPVDVLTAFKLHIVSQSSC